MSSLLEVRGLGIRFAARNGRRQAVEAVTDVSFRIERGEVFGLAGESGSGKSSIARALVRLLNPSAGQVLLDGQDLASMDAIALREARRRVQIVFQDPVLALSPRRRIVQTLLEPLQLFRPAEATQHHALALAALAEVGMGGEALLRYPHQFSSGQRQRIAIARALLARPELLIADEAVSALDVSVQAQVLQLLRRLRDQHGLALLLISHDLPVLRQLAGTVGILCAGRLVECGPIAEVFDSPRHAHTRALLAAHRLESGDTP